MSSQQSQSQSEQDEQKKIVETFQKLRQEQQEIVNEIATFEEERREHSWAIFLFKKMKMQNFS